MLESHQADLKGGGTAMNAKPTIASFLPALAAITLIQNPTHALTIKNDCANHFISFPKNPSGGGQGWDMLSLGPVNP